MSAPSKIKYLTERFLQKHSEFEAGMIIGALDIPVAFQARSVWSTYHEDLLMIHGRLIKHVIECSGDRLLIIYSSDPHVFTNPAQKYDVTTRGATNDNIMVYKPAPYGDDPQEKVL